MSVRTDESSRRRRRTCTSEALGSPDQVARIAHPRNRDSQSRRKLFHEVGGRAEWRGGDEWLGGDGGVGEREGAEEGAVRRDGEGRIDCVRTVSSRTPMVRCGSTHTANRESRKA